MANVTEKSRVWKLVLTGGPCGGKTTGQARLCTFFENLGWKVYRVPETANILLSGGVKFGDLSPEMAKEFQKNLLKTMLQIENTFFDLAQKTNKNCLVICDRGAMDASAYIARLVNRQNLDYQGGKSATQFNSSGKYNYYFQFQGTMGRDSIGMRFR